MKKLLLVLLFFVSLASISADTKIGVIGTYGFSNLTLSFDKVEIEVGANLSQQLRISADYAFLGENIALGNTDGFFWSVAVGPYIHLGNNHFALGVILPLEFGFTIPELLDGRFDIYLQLAPGVQILSGLGFEHSGGLGLRFRL